MPFLSFIFILPRCQAIINKSKTVAGKQWGPMNQYESPEMKRTERTTTQERERKKCTYEKGKNKMKKKTTEENKKLENQTKSTKSKNAHARHIG